MPHNELKQLRVIDVDVIDPVLTDEQVDAAIKALRPDALAVVQRALRIGAGNKVAVDLAKFILFDAKPRAAKNEVIETEEEAELNNVLKFVVPG